MQRTIRVNENQLLNLSEKAHYDHSLAGYLHKRAADSTKWQPRWFVLYQVSSPSASILRVDQSRQGTSFTNSMKWMCTCTRQKLVADVTFKLRNTNIHQFLFQFHSDHYAYLLLHWFPHWKKKINAWKVFSETFLAWWRIGGQHYISRMEFIIYERIVLVNRISHLNPASTLRTK